MRFARQWGSEMSREKQTVQDTEPEHSDHGTLYAPIELYVPQQKDGQDGEDPVTQDGNYGDCIGKSGLDASVLTGSGHRCEPVLPIENQQRHPLTRCYGLGDYLLYRSTLEEKIHAGAAHDYEAGRHTSIDDPLDPLLPVGNPDQRKTDGALDGDQCKAPWLLEDVEPHQGVGVLVFGE